MNLEEMQAQWSAMDAKLNRSLRLNERFFTEQKLKAAKSALVRFRIGMAVEAVVWLLIIIVLGRFIYDHQNALDLAVCGVAFDVYVIAIFASLVRQIATAGGIRYDRPVSDIQAQIEQVQVLRIQYIRTAILFGIALWAPCAIVTFQAFFGIDLYTLFGPAWVWSNVAVGLALMFAVFFAARRFGSHLSESSFARRLADLISARTLHSARRALDEAREFHSEP